MNTLKSFGGLTIALMCAFTFAFAAEPPLQLTQVQDAYPSWSPDGNSIVYQSNRTGTWQLWMIDAAGENLRRVTESSGDDLTPVWSPDGKQIAFQSEREGNRELYVMNADGGELVNITNNPSEDSHPKWSPDGTEIIFDSTRLDSESEELFIMNSDGSNVRRLTEYEGWDTYSSLSPDGRQILWRRVTPTGGASASGRNSEIFLMECDGSQVRNISNHASFDGWPAWSPDGQRVVFASDRDGAGLYHLFVMNADGSEVTQVTFADDKESSYAQPCFSPDGSKIVSHRWTMVGEVESASLVIVDVPQP